LPRSIPTERISISMILLRNLPSRSTTPQQSIKPADHLISRVFVTGRHSSEVAQNAVSREPRDGRGVGPSFRARNDAADLSKNRSMLRACRRTFVGSQGASRAVGRRRCCNGFLLNVPAPRIFHRWLGVCRNGQTYLRQAESRTYWKNEGICHHKMATKRDSTG